MRDAVAHSKQQSVGDARPRCLLAELYELELTFAAAVRCGPLFQVHQMEGLGSGLRIPVPFYEYSSS